MKDHLRAINELPHRSVARRRAAVGTVLACRIIQGIFLGPWPSSINILRRKILVFQLPACDSIGQELYNRKEIFDSVMLQLSRENLKMYLKIK
jgi:hypothetical protein